MCLPWFRHRVFQALDHDDFTDDGQRWMKLFTFFPLPPSPAPLILPANHTEKRE
jgi:hypothetical protein